MKEGFTRPSGHSIQDPWRLARASFIRANYGIAMLRPKYRLRRLPSGIFRFLCRVDFAVGFGVEANKTLSAAKKLAKWVILTAHTKHLSHKDRTLPRLGLCRLANSGSVHVGAYGKVRAGNGDGDVLLEDEVVFCIDEVLAQVFDWIRHDALCEMRGEARLLLSWILS